MKRKVVAALAMTTLAACGGSTPDSASSPEAAPPITVSVTSTPAATASDGLADPFLEWAATHKVGELDLPALVGENPSGVSDFAKGYCTLLTGENVGTVGMVLGVVKHNTNGSSEQSRALLDKAVEAYCPEKSRFLN